MAGSTPLKIEEVNAITDAIPRLRDQALFLLLAGTGMRAGEARLTTVGDVLTRDRTLRDEIHIPATRVKGRRRARQVTIPARAQHAIALWLQRHPRPIPEAPLFPSQRGELQPLTVRQIERFVSKAARAAHVEGKITPHSARKFFGTAVYELTGKDIHAASRALGHTSIAATPAYLDLDGDGLKAIQRSVFGTSSQRELSISGPTSGPIPSDDTLSKAHEAA